MRLRIRAQHLERWLVPRTTFPEGRAGYLTWRRSLYTRQAERARELLLAAGVDAAEAADVTLVRSDLAAVADAVRLALGQA